jgi:hypothetical protein
MQHSLKSGGTKDHFRRVKVPERPASFIGYKQCQDKTSEICFSAHD